MSHHRSLSAFAIDDPTGFVEMVDKLRAAGVAKLGALVIGPKPHDPAKREAPSPLAVAERKHNVMFAASSIRPPFAPPAASDNGTPRAIVQRRERDEAANGEGRSPRT